MALTTATSSISNTSVGNSDHCNQLYQAKINLPVVFNQSTSTPKLNNFNNSNVNSTNSNQPGQKPSTTTASAKKHSNEKTQDNMSSYPSANVSSSSSSSSSDEESTSETSVANGFGTISSEHITVQQSLSASQTNQINTSSSTFSSSHPSGTTQQPQSELALGKLGLINSFVYI